MHLCALFIANKPKNVTRQDLKNAPLCIVYSKDAIKYLLILKQQGPNSREKNQ